VKVDANQLEMALLNLMVNALREFEAAGIRVGISREQTDAAFKKFTENLNQYKKGLGDFTQAAKGQPAEVQAFVRSLASMDATPQSSACEHEGGRARTLCSHFRVAGKYGPRDG
jgi:hypothetical protein